MLLTAKKIGEYSVTEHLAISEVMLVNLKLLRPFSFECSFFYKRECKVNKQRFCCNCKIVVISK